MRPEEHKMDKVQLSTQRHTGLGWAIAVRDSPTADGQIVIALLDRSGSGPRVLNTIFQRAPASHSATCRV